MRLLAAAVASALVVGAIAAAYLLAVVELFVAGLETISKGL
ncbi:hypothetical protein SEA_ALTADENA_28 [Arthrobacter phage Altadena]|uniref:Uncharacterized protein n=1 Tax=Arthrobacter phage Altadena TaxID=3059064 RepID=A0AA96HU06_9CAUD|nr:hypothetical protein SEA_ALTADENA_28 [Arthrobacter phage Altadena]